MFLILSLWLLEVCTGRFVCVCGDCAATHNSPLCESMHRLQLLYSNLMYSIQKYIKNVTPTSTPKSRLYSVGHVLCLFSLNATRDPNKCAMPLWFHSIFAPQQRRHARLVSIRIFCSNPNGGTRPVRFQPVPAPVSPGVPAPPATGFHHGYG